MNLNECHGKPHDVHTLQGLKDLKPLAQWYSGAFMSQLVSMLRQHNHPGVSH